MILVVLFIVVMLLWFLSLLPGIAFPPGANGWLAFLAVLLLALYMRVHV